MATILVTYYSRTGKTKKMADEVVKGIEKEGLDYDLIDVESVEINDLINYDGIIIGSPTYYGTLAAEVKKLIDDSVKFHGKLAGKVGGAFASSGNVGGGNETTVLSILQAFIVHGMIVQGRPREIIMALFQLVLRMTGQRPSARLWAKILLS